MDIDSILSETMSILLVTMQQPNHTKVIVFTEVSKFMCTIFIGIPSFRFIR
jgi:hypothetical protein